MCYPKSENKIKPKNQTKEYQQKWNEKRKQHARVYYASPEAKEKQRLKMLKYQRENRDKINLKRRIKTARKKLEKKLSVIYEARMP